MIEKNENQSSLDFSEVNKAAEDLKRFISDNSVDAKNEQTLSYLTQLENISSNETQELPDIMQKLTEALKVDDGQSSLRNDLPEEQVGRLKDAFADKADVLVKAIINVLQNAEQLNANSSGEKLGKFCLRTAAALVTLPLALAGFGIALAGGVATLGMWVPGIIAGGVAAAVTDDLKIAEMTTHVVTNSITLLGAGMFVAGLAAGAYARNGDEFVSKLKEKFDSESKEGTKERIDFIKDGLHEIRRERDKPAADPDPELGGSSSPRT